jgi:hypothetical protein
VPVERRCQMVWNGSHASLLGPSDQHLQHKKGGGAKPSDDRPDIGALVRREVKWCSGALGGKNSRPPVLSREGGAQRARLLVRTGRVACAGIPTPTASRHSPSRSRRQPYLHPRTRLPVRHSLLQSAPLRRLIACRVCGKQPRSDLVVDTCDEVKYISPRTGELIRVVRHPQKGLTGG